MPLVVLGINHRTAPVEIREQVVFADTELPGALRELGSVPGVREAAIVSTCNRTEVYCYADDAAAPLSEWLLRWHELERQHVGESLYRLEDARAVAHLFGVAAGLDSMILGEPQILGQLKTAYRAAQDCNSTGPHLNRLFQAAFSVAKRIRTDTQIGANSVSVAAAAVNLAKTVFERFEDHTAMLVGAGETIQLAARHLASNGVKRMIIANRSLDNAQLLAQEFSGYAITLDALAAHLPEADIVISSTASPQPVITYDAVKAALRARKRRPIFMVDIAVPRDIEAKVAELEDIYLFTIDDLQTVVSENLATRRAAATDANQLIAHEVELFAQQLKTLDAVPTIRQLREQAEQVRAQTLKQAEHMLASGRDAKDVLEFLASTLTNRLTHGPSHRLRVAAEHGEADLIKAASELFELKDTKHDA
ncbi:MAG: glutamyl-tRNA reductase [Candidatus Obscuribacterales bacterium]|nr:glutamyl-tRNA reductase [Steroidobacteraceae bacterium]